MNENILDHQGIRKGPPRPLNFFTKIQVLFGGFGVQFGAVFFWFGMIFTLIFVGQSECIHWFSSDGNWVQSEGLLLEIEETNVEVNEETIYQYTFSYNVEGQSFQGISNGSYSGMLEGNLTTIEYKSDNPIRARIVGMTTEVFPSWVVFVLVFPFLGLIFILGGFRANWKALHLIINGVFTRGKMLGYKATNTEINDQTVYAYEFEFSVRGKKYISKCKTHLTERVEDEELEKIIYDLNDPNTNCVYDAIAAAPKIDQFGKLEESGVGALVYLLSTIIGLLVNGVIYWWLYL
ncbi:DUF3592 domain-containing protein [Aureispira anguillae]|uniref:DUF3592 domain-containing protein n=1 Tax=Aureispira anguillae TaxID=2864201 RepID=A0A915YJX3_9BACT|nr:DUF3592 domain-containing protein [Aureispira anguillae]BDS14430.1 DUF3592 domain-containing protein [Aureispira anguillae]